MNIRELKPSNGRKSFYGKAIVVEENSEQTLFSYETPIIKRKADGTLVPLLKTMNLYSNTTASHVIAFCGLHKKDYKKLLDEINK